ncbi:retinoic acid receptor RXR-alpha [Platysternon megacephalum]|uniref:Retinoic acid receptor RXR-alpha n=1 Tax=Platysternon megacephalum TaxID=55544 RepID=A0A4D9ENY0_9SAUR|nr:retinoic acid receptor RXR-alpha [Platysternon megacephalum]
MNVQDSLISQIKKEIRPRSTKTLKSVEVRSLNTFVNLGQSIQCVHFLGVHTHTRLSIDTLPTMLMFSLGTHSIEFLLQQFPRQPTQPQKQSAQGRRKPKPL